MVDDWGIAPNLGRHSRRLRQTFDKVERVGKLLDTNFKYTSKQALSRWENS
jgi:hypothetical protein